MGVSCCFFGGDFNLSMEPYEHHDKSKFLYLRECYIGILASLYYCIHNLGIHISFYEFKLVKSVKVKKKTESLS